MLTFGSFKSGHVVAEARVTSATREAAITQAIALPICIFKALELKKLDQKKTVDVLIDIVTVRRHRRRRRRRHRHRRRCRRRRRRCRCRGGVESELLRTVATQFRPSISGWSGSASLR